MQRDQVRQIVADQFNQSLTESKISVTAIPQEQLQAVINALADGVFAAFAAVQEDSGVAIGSRMASVLGSSASQAEAPVEETLLWRGRPYLTIGTIYELTTQRLRIIRGIFGNSVEEIELVRVHDTKATQNLGERTLNIGDIVVFADDNSTPTITLNNVTDPLAVREQIRKAVIAERQRHGVSYREVMR